MGHEKEKFRAIVSLLKVKLLLLSEWSDQWILLPLPSPQHAYIVWLQVVPMSH